MKKRMKKSLCLLGAIMIGAAVVLSGCGSSGGGSGSAAAEKDSSEAEVTAVVDGFFTTMQAGELSKLTEFCTEEVLANQELDGLSDAEAFNDTLMESLDLESMGLSNDDLSDEAKQSIAGFADSIIKGLISEYAISDISVKGDTAEVKGTVKYGYDTDFNIDTDTIVNDYINAYMADEEKFNALMDVYMNDGETAMNKQLINEMMPELLGQFTEALMATEGATDDMEVTLTKTDGKWMITEMNLYSAEEAGESE